MYFLIDVACRTFFSLFARNKHDCVYIASVCCKFSDNYKYRLVTSDTPLCRNKGRNKSNEVSFSNLRFSQNKLGLVFHSIFSCIFHPCDLLLLFPLLHFLPLQFYPYRIYHSRIFSRPLDTIVFYGGRSKRLFRLASISIA